jgi:alpha-galactosidase
LILSSWYGNNCICRDHCSTDACYEQDAKAIVNLGFDSVKLDGCGSQLDLQKWSDLFAQTGKSILIENCHWGMLQNLKKKEHFYTLAFFLPSGNTLPNATWCPWNYYRSSGDIRANYESVVSNLMTVAPLAKQGV